MNKQANQSPADRETINPLMIGKGILISYIITIPIFVIFSLILAYTEFPEKLVTPVVIITTIVSILVAGSSVTSNLSSKGWLNGAFVGLVYMLLLYGVSSVVLGNYSIDKYVVTMTLIGILTGAIGGIAGVNAKKSSHSRGKNKK